MTSFSEQLRAAFELYGRGDLRGAAAVYRRILAVWPDQPDALHFLGLVLYQAGKTSDGLAYVRSAVRLEPENAIYRNNLGIVLLAAGDAEQAIGEFRRAVELQPDFADAHANMASAFLELGRYDNAAARCREALRIAPQHADALFDLGTALCAQGQLEAGIDAYRRALAVRPQFPKAINNLANALLLQEKWQEAIQQYRRAVTLDPGFAEAHKNLGNVLTDHGRPREAIDSFLAAICAKGDFPEAMNRLGVTLFEQGHEEEAVGWLRRAIAVDPDFVEAYSNLGGMLVKTGRHEEAAAVCRQGLARVTTEESVGWDKRSAVPPETGPTTVDGTALRSTHPTMSPMPEQKPPIEALLLENLGAASKQLSLLEETAEVYRRCVPFHPDNPLYELRIDTLCPATFDSVEAIDRFHQRLNATLDRYVAAGTDLASVVDPMEIPRIGCEPPFDAAYHGRDERCWREKFAAIFRSCFDAASGPHPSPLPKGEGTIAGSATGLPRVAMVVTREHEGIFLHCMRGLVENLDPERIDLSIVCAQSGLARIRSEVANPRLAYLPVHGKVENWVETLRAGRFDVLYFFEVGSDALNYFLPFFRLAPVQCVGVGTAHTTGIPQMDYYVSSDLIEIPEAQEHYTELLVRFQTLPTYQYRQRLEGPAWDRAAFGLRDEQHVYLCAQNVRKLHPEFDQLLARVLRRDAAGVLVLIKPEHEHLETALRERFRTSMGGVTDRVLFMKRMTHIEYVHLVAAADVLLDPRPYGGGITSYDGFSLGKPIVTFPTQYHRGRYALGHYRKMGIFDCVAGSADEYVEVAVRLGIDRDWRRFMSERILAASHVLFEDIEAVRQHEAFFEQAVESARSARL